MSEEKENLPLFDGEEELLDIPAAEKETACSDTDSAAGRQTLQRNLLRKEI